MGPATRPVLHLVPAAEAAHVHAARRADAGPDTVPMAMPVMPPPGDCTDWYWRGRHDGDHDGGQRGYRVGYVAGWRWGACCGAIATLAIGIAAGALYTGVRHAVHLARQAGWL